MAHIGELESDDDHDHDHDHDYDDYEDKEIKYYLISHLVKTQNILNPLIKRFK